MAYLIELMHKHVILYVCGIECMYAETVGCIYADVGCIYAEAVGCIYADVGCISGSR